MACMTTNPYQSPREIGYDPTSSAAKRRSAWSLAQLVEGWLATGFLAAGVIPMVAYLQRLAAEPGTNRAIWWSVTLPSAGLVLVVVYLVARCLNQTARKVGR